MLRIDQITEKVRHLLDKLRIERNNCGRLYIDVVKWGTGLLRGQGETTTYRLVDLPLTLPCLISERSIVMVTSPSKVDGRHMAYWFDNIGRLCFCQLRNNTLDGLSYYFESKYSAYGLYDDGTKIGELTYRSDGEIEYIWTQRPELICVHLRKRGHPIKDLRVESKWYSWDETGRLESGTISIYMVFRKLVGKDVARLICEWT